MNRRRRHLEDFDGRQVDHPPAPNTWRVYDLASNLVLGTVRSWTRRGAHDAAAATWPGRSVGLDLAHGPGDAQDPAGRNGLLDAPTGGGPPAGRS